MRKHPHIYLAAVMILAAGCSGDRNMPPGTSPAGGETAAVAGQAQKESQSAGAFRIEPAEAYRGTTLRIIAAPGQPAGGRIEWLVNREIAQGGDGLAMETSRLRKGDSIQARAVDAARTAYSQTVTIRNSPPEIREIRFVPGTGMQNDALGVEVDVHDADGDDIRVEITWRRNGEPAGTGSRMGTAVKRGDKVDVTITPFDGEEPGRSATLTREIRNTPPVIEGQEQFQVSGNVVTFNVRASDPDGDPLTYALRDAPPGMLMDKATGRVRWETAPGSTGKIPFTVLVRDAAGGESTALFTVTIAEEPPSLAR